MDCSHVFDFKVSRLTVVFTLFLAFFFVTPLLYAQEDTLKTTAAAHAEPEAEKKFNLGKFALHHIADSHTWHVIGDYYIGLPVILYTPGGLAMFNSTDFHHDDEAKVVVESAGQRFVIVHDKIYYAAERANAKKSVKTTINLLTLKSKTWLLWGRLYSK